MAALSGSRQSKTRRAVPINCFHLPPLRCRAQEVMVLVVAGGGVIFYFWGPCCLQQLNENIKLNFIVTRRPGTGCSGRRGSGCGWLVGRPKPWRHQSPAPPAPHPLQYGTIASGWVRSFVFPIICRVEYFHDFALEKFCSVRLNNGAFLINDDDPTSRSRLAAAATALSKKGVKPGSRRL